jgi:hypothetical protein
MNDEARQLDEAELRDRLEKNADPDLLAEYDRALSEQEKEFEPIVLVLKGEGASHAYAGGTGE